MRKWIIECVSLPVVLSFCFLSLPQAQTQNKKKLKDFGSSLEKLKWDPIKKESVIEPSRSKTGDEDIDVVRVETSLVAWDVLVIDSHGNNIRGLTADDFQVSENEQPQTVGHFLLGDNQSVPRKIVLIIDYSGSQLPFIRNSVDAAKVLVDSLASQDRLAIVTDDVELLVDFTQDKKLLKKKLESLVERTKQDGGFLGFGKERQLGKSRQYSAFMATLYEMFTEPEQREIIVFQTDGDEIYRLRDPIIPPSIPPDLPPETRADAEMYLARRQQAILENQTIFSLADVYRAAEKSRATVYTVIPGYRLVGLSPEDQLKRAKHEFERSREMFLAKLSSERRAEIIERENRLWRPFSEANLKARTHEAYKVQLALAALASRTGGWTDYLEKPEQAASIYSRIFSDINQRYIIGYYPTNKEHDGKRRTIKVAIKGHPEYTIIGRRSYYAPVN
ncbi:MAG TPA: VWA domain-containing protein [Pyrinomonadaceae bacterium]|jgi:VWFA-related protein|nr:VWA domain-containing protein [Pyrinomonadaceae bacterium]